MLKKCIEQSPGVKIVSSNYQLDEEVQKKSDYCLVSKKNEILEQKDFSKFSLDYFFITKTPTGNLRKSFEFEHGYAVYCLIRDALRLAKSLGFEKVHVVNYDYLISKKTFERHLSVLNDNDCIFYNFQKQYYDIDSFNTGFFSGKTDVLLKFFEYFKTKEEYYINKPFPINILEIKCFKFFEESNSKILKIPNDILKTDGNKINLVGINWGDEKINIPL